jgi:hypothetical protein
MFRKLCLFALAAALGMAVSETAVFADDQYPDLRGAWFRIGSMLSADGMLMPVRKDQKPPDLRNFER